MTKQALFFELIGGIGVLLIVAAVFMGGVAHATSNNTPKCVSGGSGATNCGGACQNAAGGGGCKSSCAGALCDGSVVTQGKCKCGSIAGQGGTSLCKCG